MAVYDLETLKKLIARRHPEYDDLKRHWDFLEATYKGGRSWFTGNLFKYVKEGEQEYKDRLERAYRFNHTREVVDLIDKYLFKSEIDRSDDAPDPIKRFWAASTRAGLPISEFSRQFSRNSSIFGSSWVVVDNNAPGGILTRKDEKSGKFKIYAHQIIPQNILDLAWGEDGDLSWVLLFDPKRDDDDPFFSSGEQIERYRLWTRDYWQLYRVDRRGVGDIVIDLDDSGDNKIGTVPLVRIDCFVSDEAYSAPSLIGDIAYLDRAIANYLSNLDAIIQDQTFSQLAMPAQGLLPGESGYDKLLEMGTKRVFTFDGERGEPRYLSPDVKQATLILDVIAKIINEIYHSVGVAGERTKQDNSLGIDNSSGVAKAYDFDRVNSLLASKAAALQQAECKIAGIVDLWTGGDGDMSDVVQYPSNFDVRGLWDEFDISMKLAAVEAPDTVRREQMEEVVEKLFPCIKKDLLNKMKEELKDWPPEIDPLLGMQSSAPGKKPPTKSVQGQNRKSPAPGSVS